jgi:choline transporter-like protein 2/4/5
LTTKGMVKDRWCTDILCCLIFVAYLVLMVVITFFAFGKGEPSKLFTPFDSDGNRCGQPLQSASIGYGTRDFTEYQFKAFTELRAVSKGGADTDVYNAVCVKECPKEMGDVMDCLTNADVPNCARAEFNSKSILNYCLPDPK